MSLTLKSDALLMQNEPAYFSELLPVPNILSGIRAHYWESPLPDSLKQAQAGSLTLHELREVRRGLLEVVGVFLKAAATQQGALSTDSIQVRRHLAVLTCTAACGVYQRITPLISCRAACCDVSSECAGSGLHRAS